MPSITVLIAHPEKSSRDAYLHLLQPEKGIRVVGEARNGLEVIRATAKLRPHILLVYLNLSKANGIALLPALRQKSHRTKVILITHGISEARILEALSYGALGYLEEKLVTTLLVKAVRLVGAGGAWVPRKMVGKIIGRLICLTASQAP